jgi:hypothetical protein
MHRFYNAYAGHARRITAHRQTWFSSNTVTLSPEERRNMQSHIQGSDAQPDARWKDIYSERRASIAIYDLIDAENVRARAIAGAVDDDNMELAKNLSKNDAPIKIINELLRLSYIPIEISVKENDKVVASKSGCEPYSIAELSDGERNALLIAANVLTAKSGTLILIDEPERHLHRSIISPLLTLLFAKRPDCVFIISTHEVMLPLDNPSARSSFGVAPTTALLSPPGMPTLCPIPRSARTSRRTSSALAEKFYLFKVQSKALISRFTV